MCCLLSLSVIVDITEFHIFFYTMQMPRSSWYVCFCVCFYVNIPWVSRFISNSHLTGTLYRSTWQASYSTARILCNGSWVIWWNKSMLQYRQSTANMSWYRVWQSKQCLACQCCRKGFNMLIFWANAFDSRNQCNIWMPRDQYDLSRVSAVCWQYLRVWISLLYSSDARLWCPDWPAQAIAQGMEYVTGVVHEQSANALTNQIQVLGVSTLLDKFLLKLDGMTIWTRRIQLRELWNLWRSGSCFISQWCLYGLS